MDVRKYYRMTPFGIRMEYRASDGELLYVAYVGLAGRPRGLWKKLSLSIAAAGAVLLIFM